MSTIIIQKLLLLCALALHGASKIDEDIMSWEAPPLAQPLLDTSKSTHSRPLCPTPKSLREPKALIDMSKNLYVFNCIKDGIRAMLKAKQKEFSPDYIPKDTLLIVQRKLNDIGCKFSDMQDEIHQVVQLSQERFAIVCRTLEQISDEGRDQPVEEIPWPSTKIRRLSNEARGHQRSISNAARRFIWEQDLARQEARQRLQEEGRLQEEEEARRLLEVEEARQRQRRDQTRRLLEVEEERQRQRQKRYARLRQRRQHWALAEARQRQERHEERHSWEMMESIQRQKRYKEMHLWEEEEARQRQERYARRLQQMDAEKLQEAETRHLWEEKQAEIRQGRNQAMRLWEEEQARLRHMRDQEIRLREDRHAGRRQQPVRLPTG